MFFKNSKNGRSGVKISKESDKMRRFDLKIKIWRLIFDFEVKHFFANYGQTVRFKKNVKIQIICICIVHIISKNDQSRRQKSVKAFASKIFLVPLKLMIYFLKITHFPKRSVTWWLALATTAQRVACSWLTAV